MSQPEDVPFTINITIDHPPFFVLTSQFVQDDHDTFVQHHLACAPLFAPEIYRDAKTWARENRGKISSLDTSGKKSVFSVTIPIVFQAGPLDSAVVQPGAFFLTNAQSLFWNVSRLLQERRLRQMLQRKYGPRTDPPKE